MGSEEELFSHDDVAPVEVSDDVEEEADDAKNAVVSHLSSLFSLLIDFYS